MSCRGWVVQIYIKQYCKYCQIEQSFLWIVCMAALVVAYWNESRQLLNNVGLVSRSRSRNQVSVNHGLEVSWGRRSRQWKVHDQQDKVVVREEYVSPARCLPVIAGRVLMRIRIRWRREKALAVRARCPPSWPSASVPSPPARAATDGPDEPHRRYSKPQVS